MGVGVASIHVQYVVVKKSTFAISSPDEFLLNLTAGLYTYYIKR